MTAYDNIMRQLFESAPEERFVVLQQSTSPLQRVDDEKILASIVDPSTGKPYQGGMILEGEFASIDVLNNNNRYYTEENYLQFVELLKFQIHNTKGVYGECEHPKGYAVNSNNISHKILDIWYDKSKKKVFGIILLLNNAKGRDLMEIVRSGGQIAVSGRGGGSENKNPDGTVNAQLKLMVTYDIVYHPGFTTSVLDYSHLNGGIVAQLNENTICIYETKLGKLDNLYESYKLESTDKSFIQWVASNNFTELFESDQQSKQQKDQQVMEQNEPSNEDEVEHQLQDAVDQELTENELMQQAFFNQTEKAQLGLKKRLGDRAYYDNTAGFIDNSLSDMN